MVSPKTEITASKFPKFLQIPLITEWGWLIAFWCMCAFNGWVLKKSNAALPLVIYFAIFPLASIVSRLTKNTKIIVSSLIISQAILALGICYLNLKLSLIALVLYGINSLFFAFILLFVSIESGIMVPAFIVCVVAFLLIFAAWEWIARLVWYCNLAIATNKAGRQLRNFFENFDSAIFIKSGIAAIGLSVGWVIGGLF
ncbi:MAG: hypothetical protein QNJ47_08690 [Nostocaceae cyanobacterium]|nr:hypothetical protein [Nostocaceae cyanobacterium]